MKTIEKPWTRNAHNILYIYTTRNDEDDDDDDVYHYDDDDDYDDGRHRY